MKSDAFIFLRNLLNKPPSEKIKKFSICLEYLVVSLSDVSGRFQVQFVPLVSMVSTGFYTKTTTGSLVPNVSVWEVVDVGMEKSLR